MLLHTNKASKGCLNLFLKGVPLHPYLLDRKKGKKPFHHLCNHQQFTILCNYEMVYTYEII